MPSAIVYVSLVLLFHLTSVEAKCGNPCHCLLGEKIFIPCGITVNCSWPLWRKGTVTITNEGWSDIHPAYAARYSFDADNQTLIIDKVEKSDAGRYECFLPKYSPEAVEVIVEEPVDACFVKIIGIVLFSLSIMMIFIQCYILIWVNKKCKQNENIRKNVHTVFSILMLVIAAVLFITVLVCFPFEEWCTKLTKMEHIVFVSLLVVLIIVSVLGVINGLVNNYLVRKRKNAPGYKAQYAKRTFDNHMTGGDTGSIKDNAEVPNTEQLLKELEKEGSVND